MKSKWPRKLLALALSFMMVLSLLPAQALAADGETEVETIVTVDDDFIVLNPGQTHDILVETENAPEGAQVRYTSTDGTVAHVQGDGNTVVAYSEGITDLTVEVYTTSGSWWNQVTTVHATATIRVTVVPEKSADDNRLKLGIQLYNFRNEGRTGQLGIDLLRELAAMGYDGVEWYSGNINLTEKTALGVPYEEVAAVMAELGLESAGIHYNRGLLDNASQTNVGTVNEANMTAVLEMCDILGIDLIWAQCSYPMKTGAPVDLSDKTPEDIDAILEIVRQQFELQRAYFEPAGIRIMYHNHAEVYEDSTGELGLSNMGWDVMQLDYYWLVKGLVATTGIVNEDASLAYAEEMAPEIVSLHIKDGTTDVSTSSDYTSWGQGELNIPAIIEIGRRYDNIEWAIVENDGASGVNGGALQDARISAKYAREELEWSRIPDPDTVPAVVVDDDFIVLNAGDSVELGIETVNAPEGATVRVSSSNGSVAYVKTGTNTLLACMDGTADLTVELVKTENRVTTVLASATVRVTVVPEKSTDDNRLKLGIQLYNFRNEGRTGQLGIDLLRELAAMGYDGVEWYSGNINLTARTALGVPYEEVAAVMEELGLESAGIHYNRGLLVDASQTNVGTINEANMAAVLDMCDILGIDLIWAQCSYPMKTGAPVDLSDKTPEDIDAILEIVRQQFALQREYFEPAGIRIMYHNHAEVYEDSTGELGLSNMGWDAMQLDYYWLVKGLVATTGVDSEDASLAYAEKMAPEIVSLHIKDGTTDITTRSDYTSWGSGELNIPAIIEIGRRYDNIEWAIVENDGAANVNGGALQDARISAKYAREELEWSRIPDPDTVPAVEVADDFVVMKVGESLPIELNLVNAPEGAKVRFASTDGTVAHVLNGANEILAYDEGITDLTVEVYTTSGSWWNQVTTVHATTTVRVTVVPEKSADDNRLKLGIQLYNFRNEGRTGQLGIDLLRELAAMGYDGVEWYSGNINLTEKTALGVPYEEVAAVMAELGLESAGIHYNRGLLDNASQTNVGTVNEANMTAVLEMCDILGIDLIWAQCSYPMKVGAPVDLTDKTTEEIDAILEIVRQQFALQREYFEPAGIRIMYHNHAEVYEDSTGELGLSNMGWDVMQLDYYWLVKGLVATTGIVNEDASLAYAEKMAPQIASLHIKDGTTDVSTSSDYTSWGQGELNIPAIIEIGRRYDNIEWAIVENDGASGVNGGALQDARISAKYAREELEWSRLPNMKFEDVEEGKFYYDAVEWAVREGIVKGITETTFGPNATVTRGQVVTFLWRAAGSPAPVNANTFTDVKEGSYCYDAVAWASENGIAKGISENLFAPNEPCTRAEVVTFLWRAAGKPDAGTENPFTDLVEGKFYYDAALWAVKEGVTEGISADTFAPDNTCTRGQAVTFLYRYMVK